MDFQHAALATCGAVATYVWYKLSRTFTISDLPGPKNPSWIYGHLWWWLLEESKVVEKSLLEEYGAIARWNGSLGEERLWVADPKAIHHVLQGSSHVYNKSPVIREQIAVTVDKGLGWAEGDTHKRQRRVMAPAFGLVEAKALYPYFAQCSNSLSDKWCEAILSGESAIINVYPWLRKATLDAIGAGALDYDFGALENADNKLTKTYANMTFNAFARPSKQKLFVMSLIKWFPEGFFAWISDRDKSKGMVQIRENRTYAHEVATRLIDEKKRELEDGTSRKDILSLLVKSNSAVRPDWRLKDEEVVAQVRTIMAGGHETTARTLTFALWELAKNSHVQRRLRAEIMEMLGKIRMRGDNDFTVNDFDSMPYLLAVVKEALRVYPVVIEIWRVSNKDDVIPLSTPIVGVSGKIHQEVHIPSGTPVAISTIGYNSNKNVWGPDAYEFRPERWLEMNEKPEFPLGVYSNLATFSGGPKGCIGWRFTVVEMHAFLVTLIRHFDFSLPENGQKIRLVRSGSISPFVVGEEHKGQQMPLKITILGNE